MCYKTARTLLSNLTNKYPPLISVMLNKLKHLLPQAGNVSSIIEIFCILNITKSLIRIEVKICVYGLNLEQIV